MKALALTLLACTLFSSVTLAQQTGPAAAPAAAAPAADMTDGEVRRIDKGASKLTLKHGDIKNLDMPPMTMVFQVKDPSLLEKLKVGDKVKFRAEKAGSSYIVTAIESAP